MPTPVLAVDLGATSARVCRVDLDARPLRCEVVHREAHGPERGTDGRLRWRWAELLASVEHGLRTALAQGPAASIGVDTWGVDYGLLGRSGSLLSPPRCYRDTGTTRWRELADRLGVERLYDATGIQLLPINTIFRLVDHDREEIAAARRLLMLPELVVHHLTGAQLAEVSSAGTTGLLDVRTRQWSAELIDALGLDPGLFAPICPAGTRAGTWQGVPVHLVAGHDTASAVLALPASSGPAPAFVCSGSWLLVGAERPRPDTSAAARAGNFSNEPGAFGGIRLLKNLAGLALLERLRAQWGSPPVAELAAAAAAAGVGPVVDTDAEVFESVGDLEAELRRAAGLPRSAGRGEVVGLLLDSLAARVGTVLGELDALLGRSTSELLLVGGGVRLAPFVERLVRSCGKPVRRGEAEASAIGNALAQGYALGRFAALPAPAPVG